jgi:hypothetical protein
VDPHPNANFIGFQYKIKPIAEFFGENAAVTTRASTYKSKIENTQKCSQLDLAQGRAQDMRKGTCKTCARTRARTTLIFILYNTVVLVPPELLVVLAILIVACADL